MQGKTVHSYLNIIYFPHTCYFKIIYCLKLKKNIIYTRLHKIHV